MTTPLPAAQNCPCGSGAAFAACCEPLIDGASATTAESLMRSRYSAYATGQLDYVFRTWHPRTRPVDISPVPGMTWVRLEVLKTVDGGDFNETGTVEFRAWYISAGRKRVLHETSRFTRRAGRWVYVDGDIAE
jgi:SEC-C motif-containing protein